MSTYSPEVVHVKITTWVGSSVCFAEHYYARFHFYNEDEWEEKYGNIVRKKHEIDIEYAINKEEAALLKKDDESYKVGDTSCRFFSRDKVIATARGDWLTEVPHGKVLLVGDMCCCGPAEIIEGPNELKRIGNKLWREWENQNTMMTIVLN